MGVPIGFHHTEVARAKMRAAKAAKRVARLHHREAEALREGDMVICKPFGRKRHTIGLLVKLRITSPCIVQFGSAGPIEGYAWTSLRRATIQEIKDAGLWGVGCNQANDE